MVKKRYKSPQGFTLVELMVAMVIFIIIACAVGVLLVDGQRGWNVMYSRIHSDVITDGYVARRKFDSVIRRASGDGIVLGEGGSWLEVNYYSDYFSTDADRYARFYAADGDLNFEYGQLEPRATLGIETVCGNVTSCTFNLAGQSAQMILTLGNKTQTNTIVSSAIPQNQ